MKTNQIKLRPDRLNFPLATCDVGRLSSAVFEIVGDIPDDIDGITVQVERHEDPVTHEPRANLTACASPVCDGTFRCYLSPFHFPDVSIKGLHYHILANDIKGNPRWLGTGALVVHENPANGTPEVAPIIPPDTYIRNPTNGLYYKLTAELNELGEIVTALSSEGVTR